MAAQKPFYQSLKFWYAVGGVAVIYIGHLLDMEVEKILGLAGVASMLIGGQAASDIGKHAKAVEAEANKYANLTNQITFFKGLDVVDEEQKKKVKETLDKLLDMAAAIKK